jgi:hypothetical protein
MVVAPAHRGLIDDSSPAYAVVRVVRQQHERRWGTTSERTHQGGVRHDGERRADRRQAFVDAARFAFVGSCGSGIAVSSARDDEA